MKVLQQYLPKYVWRCGQYYASKRELLLHCSVTIHCYDITHQRTEEPPVAKQFNSETHSQADMAVMVINQIQNCDPCLCKI